MKGIHACVSLFFLSSLLLTACATDYKQGSWGQEGFFDLDGLDSQSYVFIHTNQLVTANSTYRLFLYRAAQISASQGHVAFYVVSLKNFSWTSKYETEQEYGGEPISPASVLPNSQDAIGYLDYLTAAKAKRLRSSTYWIVAGTSVGGQILFADASQEGHEPPFQVDAILADGKKVTSKIETYNKVLVGTSIVATCLAGLWFLLANFGLGPFIVTYY